MARSEKRPGGRDRRAGEAEAPTTSKDLKIRPATPSRWSDLESLFGERGACGGCWCMAWRLPYKSWVAGKGTGNKRAFKRIVMSGEAPGIMGYFGKEAVAWCAVAPRESYTYLERSRVLKPIDDRPVWSVSCLFVQKSFRRRGISTVMLRGAVEFAAKRGAKIVEGYPVIPTMEKTPDSFVWTGLPSAFHEAGFREAKRWSKNRPIMRFMVPEAEEN